MKGTVMEKPKTVSMESYERAIKENDRLRKHNGLLKETIRESCPERIGPAPLFEILPLEASEERQELASRGMRASKEPCVECGDHWEEPSRRGRMNRRCLDCRD